MQRIRNGSNVDEMCGEGIHQALTHRLPGED